jgi:protein-L-isoaspartate O-methyltransferase
MAFKDTTLTFEDGKIMIVPDFYFDSVEVMMSWEAPIMEKSAEYICESKGDILEIGFGMGICSDYIQAQDVNSHTIVEIHPQVVEKLKVWAEDKDNVTIVEGDWYTSDEFGTYDGIFFDTYADNSLNHLKEFSLSKAKEGAKITYWNNYADTRNKFGFDNISFEEISVIPSSNGYTKIIDTYYMPKVGL